MSTKTYDKKTAAFGGYVIQNIPSDLDEDTMDNWMDNPDALKKFLSGLKPPEPETVPPKPTPLFSVVATTSIGATGGKKTKKCFISPRYAYRDSDFDNWLPDNQPKADACAIATLASSRSWTFAEAAAAILGIGADTDAALLGKLTKEHGYTVTLPQVEEMMEKNERGEKTEMRTDGYANFFFVETGDPKNPVSVGHVIRDERAWDANVHRLDHAYRWYADNRLLVRNLKDTSKL
ncbi:MAG: hypothetical protein Q8O94_01190 [bacterium]|nr:hypothetical protein [bacterium]